MQRFALAEIAAGSLIGKLPSGLAVTIAVRDMSGAAIALTSAVCTEQGTTGMYRWALTNITVPPVAFAEYTYVMTSANNDTYEDAAIISGYPDVIDGKIGTPVALDGGSATLAGNLTKIADDNNGVDYNAGTDSLHEISDVVDLIQTDTNNIRTVDVPAILVDTATILATVVAYGLTLTAIGNNVVEIKQLLQNKMVINRATSELWLYDDAGTTVIKKWSLTDKDGRPVVLKGTEPANRGKVQVI